MNPPSSDRTSQQDHFRLVLVALGLFFLFALLIVQFFRVQITQHAQWLERAQRQHYFIVTEPFRRGSFYSNTDIIDGHPEAPQAFSMDIQKFHAFVDPFGIPEEYTAEICAKLIDLLTVPAAEQATFRAQFDMRTSRSRKLRMWVDPEVRESVDEWWRPYARKRKIPVNALFFVADYRRSFPFGKLLGQALHTIQENKEERTRQGVPTGGLEAYFDKYLRGKLGKRRLMRSPRNAFAMGDVIEVPENGADIYLSVNHMLQAIAEEELEVGVKDAGAKGGWAVMMDPHTGDILAMAQYPFFNPSEYRDYFNTKERIMDTRLRAATDAYEPGSIIKPITIAIALQGNRARANAGKPPLFSPEEKIATSDGRFPGRSKPITDTHHHNYLNMYMGLQRSSNIYMGRVIQRVVDKLGNQWYRDQLTKVFGFGKRTGIELPIETDGVVPTPGKTHANGKLEWSVPTPFSLAMGYNIQTSGLQLVRAYGILASGGLLVQPSLVRKIVKDGKVIWERPHTPFPRVIDKDIIDETIKAMKYVTKGESAGRQGDIPGYTEAAKTGTARKLENGQYTNKKHVASFIGFAPTTNPRIVLLVSIDEPAPIYIPGVGDNRLGGIASGPTFRRIAARSLQYLGVTPDDPYGFAEGDPRRNKEKADWERESQALLEKYRQWNDGS